MRRPEKTPPLLKGSAATPSLVAGIMNAKYVNGMPLARQEREFSRYNLNLSTKTMANWIIQCADRYLQPLYDLMKEELLQSKYLHGDETRMFFASTFSSKMQIEFLKVAWGISPLLHFLRRHSFGCRKGAVAGIQSLLVTDM